MIAPNWTTVQVFQNALGAHAARTKLESEGIECFVADEHIVGMNWLYSNAVGGVKLQVHPADLERAQKLLREESDPVPAEEIAGEAPNPALPPRICPACQSEDVSYDRFSRSFAALTWLIFNIPLPWLKRKWTCRACGHEWKTS